MATNPVQTATMRGEAPGRERLVGRRILVMGAGQEEAPEGTDPNLIGNGRAISLLAAREGAAVACVDLDLGRAQATADAVEAEGGRAVAFAADTSVDADVKRVLAEAKEALGGLDGLVLSVGVSLGGQLAETELEDLERAMRINVGGQFLGLKHGMEVLESGGSVVMISAIAAVISGFTTLPYDTSKAALGALLRHGALAGESNGVRVNMVMPGAMDTPMVMKFVGGETPQLPWGRLGTAWETAHAVIFLLSDEASYVSGSNLLVDGGFIANHK